MSREDLWTEDELRVLQEFYSILPMSALQRLLPDRGKMPIYAKAFALDLKRPKAEPKPKPEPKPRVEPKPEIKAQRETEPNSETPTKAKVRPASRQEIKILRECGPSMRATELTMLLPKRTPAQIAQMAQEMRIELHPSQCRRVREYR